MDEIWYFFAQESGSFDIADRFVDTMYERYYCWRTIHPSEDNERIQV